MSIFVNAKSNLKNSHRHHKMTEVKSLILLDLKKSEMRNIISIRFYESKSNIFCCVFLHGHHMPELDYLQGSSKMATINTDKDQIKFRVLQQTLQSMGIELDSLPPTWKGLYYNENSYLCDTDATAISITDIGSNKLINLTMEMLAIALVPEWEKWNESYDFYILTECA